MRILQVHKYLNSYHGAARYFFDISALLLSHGHEVALWGTDEDFQWPMAHSGLDKAVVYKDLLVKEIRFDKREGLLKDAKKAFHFVYSFEAAKKFRLVLERFKPDIIHIHNIYHHLTPSILQVAHKKGIPVVMTMHDWSLLNPNYSLFDHGAICERHGLSMITHRCIQNSVVASALSMLSFALGQARHDIQHFRAVIAPVPFVAHKLVRHGGISKEKVHVLSYPLGTTNGATVHRASHAEDPFVLYVGRLSAEKGVNTLIAAAKHLPQTRFVIVGTGSQEITLRAQAARLGAHNIEFMGFQNREAVEALQARAALVVVPSVWYEISPYAVLEAQVAGKVVVASTIGGLPDLIEDGKNGFLVPRGNAQALATRIKTLLMHPRMLDTIGRNARERIIADHDPEEHYQKLFELYERVVAQ